VVAAAEATEAATDAEIGIHEVEELRGIRANLDSQDPVVEYRVHWKDGSADTWYACPLLSSSLLVTLLNPLWSLTPSH
jgi:hypothetical protein